MSAYLYDQAIVDQFRKLTGDERVHIIHPDSATSFFAQFDKDKVKLPAIVISRNSIALGDYRNQVVALKGQTARIDEDNFIVKAHLVPMRMDWNVDVYAVDRYTCDEIVRELIFYIIMHPRFEVTVPYNLNIPQNFDIFLSSDIVDNSDLVEFPNRGEFFRETFTIYTENAHFFHSHRQYQVSGKINDPEIIDRLNNYSKGDE